MASVPALSVSHHCCSAPAWVVVSWLFSLFIILACQHSTDIVVWHLLKPPKGCCFFFPSDGVTHSCYSDGVYLPLKGPLCFPVAFHKHRELLSWRHPEAFGSCHLRLCSPFWQPSGDRYSMDPAADSYWDSSSLDFAVCALIQPELRV